MSVNLRNIDLNLLTIFDAIMAERSMTRAAARLAMTQPALSNALGRLRRTLDDPLFTRTSTGMTPTPRASSMAGPVREALDLVQRSLREPSEFDFRSAERRFTLAMSDYAEAVLMPRFVDWMARAAPGISLEIRPGAATDFVESLREGEVDLAADYVAWQRRGFRREHLFDESFLSLVREDHPEVGDRLNLKQFLGLSHVVLTPRPDRVPLLEALLRERGLTRKAALRVPHLLSMPLVVSQSDFVCTLPARMAREFADQFRLKTLQTPIKLAPLRVFQIWHSRMDNDPAHRWLRRSLLDLCRRL